MKDTIHAGTTFTRRLTVDRDRTISFMGEEGRVYATPSLIRDVELTCRELILQHADPGEDSVGMEVALKHLAPTLPGMEVEITVTVNAVEKRKIVFDVAVKDTLEPISGGSHTRFVVDTAKTIERLKAKAAKVAAARAG
ncbi:MAG TPA: LysR family transcriptional regulator [Xanthobacteraceae bacterium]|nr:LysR family transcriptional regulator [Xanthobacteraceae bacterium]